MTNSNLKRACILFAVASLGGVGHAQVENLSSARVGEYAGQLPATIAGTNNAAWKAYLQGLAKPSPVDAKDKATGQTIANAVRVSADAKTAGLGENAYYLHYAVPAMSPRMRLPGEYPVDGKAGGEVQIVLAQDEYEPGSFVVQPFLDAATVELKVGDLKSADGSVFPKEELDLKVVKVWYQNGNGWFSYFQDVGLELVPELLLNDENLIRVDTQKKANFARINDPAGAREVWISAPRKIDPGFDPYSQPFADAATFQPVAFAAGQFKQFILTAHAGSQTRPGLYKGSIAVTAAGQAPSAIPVAVRVLPFQLPRPAAAADVRKPFLVTMMGAWPRVSPDHKAFLPTLKDMRRHNLLHLGPNVQYTAPPKVVERNIRLMKEAGFETDAIFAGWIPGEGYNNAPPMTYDQLINYRKIAQAHREFYLKNFGHTNAIFIHGDEQAAQWIMRVRPLWRIVNEAGLKTEIAGHDLVFIKGGYALNVFPAAGSPGEAQKARTWNAVGDNYVSFYANQHTGSENPEYVRRQHGLLGYLSGFDMVNNYEFAYGPWNDRGTDLYKPMVLAYPTSEGLVDTLGWEGFREGIDDVRYATKLRQLAAAAIAGKGYDRIYAGRKVRQWFALMDGAGVDLNTVRMEMIQKIEELTQLEKTDR